jgi:GxxExxY protein
MPHNRQVPLPLIYRGSRLDCGYRLDVIVQDELVLEVKAVERLLPIHDVQILSYLRLGGYKTGLLLNFHTTVLKDGIRRFVL